MMSGQPIDKLVKSITLTLPHECHGCKGHTFTFWWETRQRRVWACADKDCGIVWIEPLREEIVI